MNNKRDLHSHSQFISGVMHACNRIRNDWTDELKHPVGRRMFLAMLELVCQSKQSAEKWIIDEEAMIFKPVEKDKKGKPTRYRARWHNPEE